jgi:hypothetical protein
MRAMSLEPAWRTGDAGAVVAISAPFAVARTLMSRSRNSAGNSTWSGCARERRIPLASGASRPQSGRGRFGPMGPIPDGGASAGGERNQVHSPCVAGAENEPLIGAEKQAILKMGNHDR